MDYMGDIRDVRIRKKLAGVAASWLQKRLAEGREKRLAQANQMHALTDGNGSARIAKSLLQAPGG